MTDYKRRTDWKDNLGKAARSRHDQKLALIVKLDATREAIQKAGINFPIYDSLKAEQREIVAALATL
jgi:hypothetical protein